MSNASTWMILEVFTLSERSQSQKITYYLIALLEMSRIGKLMVIKEMGISRK
jgi:hypothetical protein